MSGTFGFLYYLNRESVGTEHYRYIRAKNIDSACKKIARYFRGLKSDVTLDHDVTSDIDKTGNHIDILYNQEVSEWLA